MRIARKNFDVSSYAHKTDKTVNKLNLLSTLSATRQTKVCRPKRKSGSVLNKAAFRFVKWLGRKDSNLRMPDPKTGALPLGYAPIISETDRKRPKTLL